MTRHIREALRLAGLKQSDVLIDCTGKHPHITVNGRLVVCSSTPRNPDTAKHKLAKDLRAALNS